MNLIQRLFGKSEESSEVLCPHCERAMEAGHRCAGMSRRYFFGAMAGAAAGAAVVVALSPPVVLSPAPQLALADLEDIAIVSNSSYGGTFSISFSMKSYNHAPTPFGKRLPRAVKS